MFAVAVGCGCGEVELLIVIAIPSVFWFVALSCVVFPVNVEALLVDVVELLFVESGGCTQLSDGVVSEQWCYCSGKLN